MVKERTRLYRAARTSGEVKGQKENGEMERKIKNIVEEE